MMGKRAGERERKATGRLHYNGSENDMGMRKGFVVVDGEGTGA